MSRLSLTAAGNQTLKEKPVQTNMSERCRTEQRGSDEPEYDTSIDPPGL